MTGLQSFGY